jgi:hypothetical protein
MVSRFDPVERANVIRKPDAAYRLNPRGVTASARAAAERQQETHPPDARARQAGNTDTAGTGTLLLSMEPVA